MKHSRQSKLRILKMVDEPFLDDAFGVLRELAEIETIPVSESILLSKIAEFDAYYCSLGARVTRDVIDAGVRLRAIATPSTGTDHIDTAYAESKGIPVISLKDDPDFLRSITSTAELAWGLLLSLVRCIPQGFEAAKRGLWGRDQFRGHQVCGKTLGIIGLGRLGTMVARYGQAFGMQTIGCDIRNVELQGVAQVTLETLLQESDVISIHVHLTDETRGLIGRDAFSLIRPHAVIINTSRGGLIDEHALLEALENGKIGGAAVDVVDGEWNEQLSGHPLIRYARSHDNLVITPHVGGVTFEAQTLAFRRAAEMLREKLLQ